MASFRMSLMILQGSRIYTVSKVNFSKSSSCCNVWRLRNGLEANPNSYGPLRNLPDFSYVDGRPVPLGYMKRTALKRQIEYCKQIVELSKEIDDGLKEYNESIKAREQEVKRIINNKLKPKGANLLQKNVKT